MARVKIKVAGSADVITDQSVGSVGAVENDQGALVDGDFPDTTDLVYYHLDGDLVNDSSGGIPLIVDGASTFDSVGFFGRESIYRTSGANAFHSTDASFDFVSNFSFGAWINLSSHNDISTLNDLFHSWVQTGNLRRYVFEMDINDDSFSFYTSPDGTATVENVISGGASQFFGRPVHLALTYDSGTSKLYIDGKLFGEFAGTIYAAGAHGFGYGAIDNGGTVRPPNGTMQDLFFKKATLTPAQINALYSKRFSGKQIAGGHVLTDESFPFSDLSGKVSYWNLNNTTQLTDGSVNAKTLANTGGVAFTGLDIFGQSNVAVFDGTAQNLSVTDDALFLGPKDMTFGFWLSQDDWSTGSSHEPLQIGSGNDFTTAAQVHTNDGIVNFGIGTGAARSDLTVSTSEFVNGQFNHLAFKYIASSQEQIMYFNGVVVGKKVSTLPMTTSASGILGINSEIGREISGRMQGLFYAKNALSDEDIRKLYSPTIPIPGDSISPEDQQWEGHVIREDGHITGELAKGWLVDKRSDKIYVDLGGDPGETAILKLKRGK